jgi:site-specific recombinase XerC
VVVGKGELRREVPLNALVCQVLEEWLEQRTVLAAEGGADAVGSASGALIGLAVAGPPGAIAGGALGATIEHAILAIQDRFQGRSRERTEETVSKITVDLLRLSQEGLLRTDGFFAEDENGRSVGEELLEEVLVQAAQSYDERVLPFLAKLYVSVAAEPGLAAADARLLVRKAHDLSLLWWGWGW